MLAAKPQSFLSSSVFLVHTLFSFAFAYWSSCFISEQNFYVWRKLVERQTGLALRTPASLLLCLATGFQSRRLTPAWQRGLPGQNSHTTPLNPFLFPLKTTKRPTSGFGIRLSNGLDLWFGSNCKQGSIVLIQKLKKLICEKLNDDDTFR